jgi:hypothetical protein
MGRWSRRVPWVAPGLVGALVVLAGLREQQDLATPSEAQNVQPHLYDVQYPTMHYTDRELSDPVADLAERMDRGEVALEFDDTYGHGYLPSLLEALGIDVSSQALVFSRTSGQISYISSAKPRALYFTDDVYVGWPPGAPEIEIAAMDPDVGPVFYTLAQQEDSRPVLQRQLNECLRCHDTYSLTGGGVPRYLLGSGFTDVNGEQVTHEGWILEDDRLPLEYRWGGWYVTGTHGAETHMGNWVIRDPEELRDMDLTRTGNVTDLSTLIDTSRYLGKDSDIVALMVLDHQTHVQNVITRVNYDTRTFLADEAAASSPEAADRVGAIAEPLVEALLMVDTPELHDRITGTTNFAETFQARGPADRAGRSLRQLDLTARLFRYPMSYLVYSEAFDALPDVSRQYVSRRLTEILTGTDTDARFAHLSADDRAAILGILRDTKPDLGL